MRLELAYGKHGLNVELPSTVRVVEPRDVPGIPDEVDAIRQAINQPIESPPLHELVRPSDTVVIVHTDITRATPNDRILPVLLSELKEAGIQRDQITLLNALGTHRPQTRSELVEMLGADVVSNYRCEQHDCWDDSKLVLLGETQLGHRVRINRFYVEADVKILTGFVEPHLFAGFSGGPKGVLPSIAGIESVLSNHGANMVSHPRATWGITRGNPIWEEMLEVALMTRPDFLLNVTLNRNREITGVFAGDLRAAHMAGCEFCRQSAMVAVPRHYDTVITTNSGYPLDINLYQAVKGMSAAAQIVRSQGSIILAAECRDGLPDHGEYASLLQAAASPQDVLDCIQDPTFSAHDQWQVQVQALIQLKADVYVYSDGLSDEEIRQALLIPCKCIEDTVAELVGRYGPAMSICVLPEGPQTIPYVAGGSAE